MDDIAVEMQQLNVSTAESENLFEINMKRSKKILNIIRKLNTYRSTIKYLMKEEIVTLEELKEYFDGEHSEENLNKLLKKLTIYDLDIKTLIECPYPPESDGYQSELQSTIKNVIHRLEKMCKFNIYNKNKYFPK